MNVIYSGSSDLGHVTLRGDDVQEVDAKLDEVLPSMKEARQEDMLESMYKTKLRDSEQFNTCALYNQDTAQKNEPPSFSGLMEEPMPQMTGPRLDIHGRVMTEVK